MCPPTTSSPPAGHHRSTTVPLRTPPSQSYRSTGVYPLWYIYGEGKDEVFPGSTGYTQRGTHTIDSNNGTRARLPLCNPNPNRVKEKRSKTGVADVTDYRSPPPPRGEKCHTAVLAGVRQENKRRTSVFGSEKKKRKESNTSFRI